MPTTGYAAAIDSNDLIMSFIAEATWGTTPATPSFQNIRLDSEGFSGSKTRTRPSEIDSGGQASAAITTKEEATGSLNMSISAGLSYNTLLASSFNGVWTGALLYTGTTDITISSVSASGRTCTLGATAGAFTTAATAIHVGQIIHVVTAGTVTDFTARVSTVAATSLDLTECTGVFGATSNVSGTITSYGAFFAGVATAFTISASSGTTCTLTVTGAKFATSTCSSFLVKGQFIKIATVDATSAMNMIARVKSITSDTEIALDCCSVTPVDGAFSGSTANGTTIRGAMLRNGTTINTFTFQKKLAAALFLRYTGCFPTGGSLDVGTGDYLKGTMAFLCKDETSATSEISSATYVAAPTGTVIDSVKGIGTVWRGSDSGTTPGAIAALAGTTQKAGIKWNKEGAASQYGMGSSAALGMRSGKMTVSGTLTTYFLNFTLFSQFKSEVAGPISWHALDGLSSSAVSKGYMFTLCNATIMNPKVVAGGPGQDVMADFEMEGNPDISSTSVFGGKTIQADYFC